MSISPVKSPVVEFYNGANILITGGTGFVGKCLIEKILRVSTSVNQIYVVIRGKRGKSPQTRMKEMLNDALFDVLRKNQPEFEKKITCVDGDVSSPNLDLNEDMYRFLTNTITHVFHSAATVRFNEKLKTAIQVNVIGVRQIINFCNKCSRLKILVHVSTTFCHYHGTIFSEDFASAPLSEEKCTTLLDTLSDAQLDSLTPELIKPWPNTYSFTKAIAEGIIKNLNASFPIAVIRPSIVMGTISEPIPGWVDNINGPVGILLGVGAGIIRVVWTDANSECNIVPVDMVINAMLCAAWKVATDFQNAKSNAVLENGSDAKSVQNYKSVYNVVSRRPQNVIKWGDFLKLNLKHGIRYPMEMFIWYYTITLCRTRFGFILCSLFYQWIPGLLMDLLGIAIGKKPQLVKAYKKIYLFSNLLAYFCTKTWNFPDDKIRRLWNNDISEVDKEIFPFDMGQICWDEYFEHTVKGLRLYLLKQNDSSLPFCRRKLFFFWVAHRVFQVIVAGLFLWIVNSVLLNFGHRSLPLDESIVVTQKVMDNSW